MIYVQYFFFPNHHTSSDDLLVLHAIRHVATVPGECLTVGDFNAPAVDW